MLCIAFIVKVFDTSCFSLRNVATTLVENQWTKKVLLSFIKHYSEKAFLLQQHNRSPAFFLLQHSFCVRVYTFCIISQLFPRVCENAKNFSRMNERTLKRHLF